MQKANNTEISDDVIKSIVLKQFQDNNEMRNTTVAIRFDETGEIHVNATTSIELTETKNIIAMCEELQSQSVEAVKMMTDIYLTSLNVRVKSVTYRKSA